MLFFFFLIQQINQTLLSNSKPSSNHDSVPFLKKGLVFLITYSSIVLLGIPVGMYPWTWHLTTMRVLPKLVHWQIFWLQTSLSQGVTIHKTNITCIRPINITTESIVICWDKKKTWFLNNYTNDSNTVADLKKVTKLTRKITKSVCRSVCFQFWWSSMLLERNLCFSIQLSVMIYFEIWVTVERVVLNRSLCQFITMLLHPRKKKSLSTYLKIHWTSLKLRCMHITNRRHLFYSLQCLWQRIHRTDQTSLWNTVKRAPKSGFSLQKGKFSFIRAYMPNQPYNWVE